MPWYMDQEYFGEGYRVMAGEEPVAVFKNRADALKTVHAVNMHAAAPDADAGRVQITIGMPTLIELSRQNAVELERATLYAADDLSKMIDHPIARLQVGPDGYVPGNTVAALEAWHKEAGRLYDQLAAIRAEIPAELLVAHQGDMAAAVRTLVGMIERAFEVLTDLACTLESSSAATPMPEISIKRLPSGYWHIRGRGVCNWAQPPMWPCSENELRSHAFPEASEEFIRAVMALAQGDDADA